MVASGHIATCCSLVYDLEYTFAGMPGHVSVCFRQSAPFCVEI